MGALHPGCSGPIHTKAPCCVGPHRLRSPSHARGSVAKTRVRLDCCLQCVPSRVLGFAADLGIGVVPVPCLSRRLQPHNGRGEHGAFAHMENVPSGALVGSLRDRPRTPRSLDVAQKGTGAFPVPGFLYRRPGRSSSWCLAVWYPMPTAAHCGSSPSAFWLSALLPLPPPLLVRVPPTSASSPPTLSPSLLLCSLPLPLPVPRPADVE